MGRQLTRLNYEKQIIENEWRKVYKLLLRAEHHAATLPQGTSAKFLKTKAELDQKRQNYLGYLLKLQEQKDIYNALTKDLMEKCQAIKKNIRRENDLEALRHECTERVRKLYKPEDDFWNQTFNATSIYGNNEAAPSDWHVSNWHTLPPDDELQT